MSTPRPFAEPEALLAHQPFLRAIARSLLRGADGDDDVVQEALVCASQSEPPHASRLPSWLGRIARNVGLDHLRAVRRMRALHEQLAARDAAPSADEVLQQEEQRQRVVHAVLALPQPYRDVVLLRYWDDLTPAQIAARLAVPGATVRSQLQRGLAMVRERLDEGYGQRRTWLAALAPVAGNGDGALHPFAWWTLLMTKLKSVAAGAALLLVGLSVWMWLAQDLPPIGTAPGHAAPPLATSPVVAKDEPMPSAATAAVDPARSRSAAAPVGELAVRGQVLCKGVPHGEATLTLQWFAGTSTKGAPEAEFQVGCDAEGRFEWRGPRRSSASFVIVTAPRQHLKLWCNGELVMPEQREVALDVSVVVFDRVLTGRVHDRAGAPIAGARLEVNLWPESQAVSDAQGRYEMRVPAPGYPLTVRAAGYRQRLVQGYLPADAMRHEFDVELQPGARLAGRVVDGNKQPIVAAQVRASRTYDTVATDADGRFVVDGVADGARCTVSVGKPGFQPATAFGIGGGEQIEVVLQPGHAVELRVVDAAAAPVVGATVHLVPHPMSGWNRLGVTGPDGRFTLADLPSQPVDVIVEKAGCVTAHSAVDAREQKGELVVTLASGYSIRGQVFAADGSPLAGASLYCELGAARSSLRSVTDLPRAVGSRARSDAEGRFSITGLPPERFTLFAHHADHLRAEFGFVGGAVAETTLHLQRAPSITGLVLDGATEAPVPAFTVAMESGAADPVPFRAPDGRFRVRHWQWENGATLTVEVRADGYAPARFTTNALSEPAPDQNVVRLFAGTRVEGIVRDAVRGEPLAGVTVALARPDPMRRPNDGAPTDASGRFALEAVPAGEQRLRLQHAERPEVVFGPFVVGPGPGALEVRPTMGVGVALRGRVTGAADAAGLTVTAYRADGRSATATVRDDLTFELHPLGIGRTTVYLADRSGRERIRHVDIGEVDVDGFEFALRLGTGSIRVAIGGATAGHVDVQRIDGGAMGLPDRVSFTATPVVVDGLLPGRYRVTVRARQGDARGSAEVDVAASEVAVNIECHKRE